MMPTWKKDLEMCILFEDFSFVHFVVLLRAIRKAKGIYVLDENPIIARKRPRLKTIFRILQFLFPNLYLRRLGHEDFPKECFKANFGAVRFIEEQSDNIVNWPLARMLCEMYEDDRVYLALKKGVMLYRYQNAFYTLKMAEALALREGRPVYVVPRGRDWLKLFNKSTKVSIHRATRAVSLIIDQIHSLYNIIRYAGYILIGRGGLRGLLLSLLTAFSGRGNVIQKWPRTVKYAVQVTWGFHKGTERTVIGNRNRWDDSFLEDGREFSGQNLLYVYFWPNVKLRDDVDFHKRREVLYCDDRMLPATLEHFISEVLKPGFCVISSLLCEWIKGRASSDLAQATVSLMYYINLYQRFARAFRPRVYLGFDDQTITCIARSIVFKKHGIRTAGIHHSSLGGTFTNPNIAHVSFDKLFIYGQMWKKLFSPYWDNMDLDVIGPLRSDLIYQSRGDAERYRLFLKKYGNQQKKILAFPSGPGAQNLKNRTVNFFKSLQRLLSLRDDVIIIMRPRGMDMLPRYFREEFIRPGLNSGRIIFDMQEFDTWELIAYCDLIIASQTSAVLSEAFAAGKNVFSYSFSEIDELASFYSMNPLLITKTGDELLDRVNLMLDHPDSIKNYQYIQQELGQPMDGMVVERLRNGLRILAGTERVRKQNNKKPV